MFVFDFENFIDLYLNHNKVYLGILLYFNWLERYYKLIAHLLNRLSLRVSNIHIIDRRYNIIRAPPRLEIFIPYSNL
jgi:hypothetical protein